MAVCDVLPKAECRAGEPFNVKHTPVPIKKAANNRGFLLDCFYCLQLKNKPYIVVCVGL